jgi:hypothetical protein
VTVEVIRHPEDYNRSIDALQPDGLGTSWSATSRRYGTTGLCYGPDQPTRDLQGWIASSTGIP